MEWLLTKLAASWDFVDAIVIWSIQNPSAAIFWITVTSVLLNIITKATPTKIDDSIYTAAKRAILEGIQNVKSKTFPK